MFSFGVIIIPLKFDLFFSYFLQMMKMLRSNSFSFVINLHHSLFNMEEEKCWNICKETTAKWISCTSTIAMSTFIWSRISTASYSNCNWNKNTIDWTNDFLSSTKHLFRHLVFLLSNIMSNKFLKRKKNHWDNHRKKWSKQTNDFARWEWCVVDCLKNGWRSFQRIWCQFGMLGDQMRLRKWIDRRCWWKIRLFESISNEICRYPDRCCWRWNKLLESLNRLFFVHLVESFFLTMIMVSIWLDQQNQLKRVSVLNKHLLLIVCIKHRVWI